jgi:integrase
MNRELATLRRLLRLAQERRLLDRIPRIRLLRGEHNREFVLSHALEPKYLEAAPQPLRDVAVLMLETGVRPREAVGLQGPDVRLQTAVHAKHGYIVIRAGSRETQSASSALRRARLRC